MFKLKSVRNYYPHLTTIAVLLGILVLSLNFQSHPTSTITTPSSVQQSDGDRTVGTLSGTDLQVSIPNDLGLEKYDSKLNAVYNNGKLTVYFNSEDEQARIYSDYQIILDKSLDKILIKDGDRIVGVLSYNTSLGNMIIRDNQ